MDIPDLPPPDLGDVGSTPLFAPPNLDPLPARSSSPPLPPRKNALGLPPTYLSHLRTLLHQWLQQQRSTEEAAYGAHEPASLWSESRVVQIEEAIWNGAVIPQPGSSRHLLELDWEEWAIRSAKRKRIWREEKSPMRIGSPRKRLRASSVHPDDKAPVKLSVNPTALTASTPQRSPSRTPSIASAERGRGTDSATEQSSPGKPSTEAETDDAEFYRILTTLKGYEHFVTSTREDWEVLDGGDHLPTLNDRELPGAFPQTAHLREPSLPGPPPLPPKPMSQTTALGPNDLVKPVFSVHFPTPIATTSTSTIHLRRQSSLLHGSTDDSIDAPGKWWTGNGSARRWSGFAFGPDRELDENVEVEFVEGKFALPDPPASLTSSPRKPCRSGLDGRQSTTSGMNSTNSEVTSDEDNPSDWSGTERAAQPFLAKTEVVSGGVHDIPSGAIAGGDVCIVGGTILIRGVGRETEREALTRIFQALLYSIQSMLSELELLDAFRIPREADPIPVPPKAQHFGQKSSTTTSYIDSPSLGRNASLKDRRDKAKNFFQRLGKDTRGMLGGLMGRHRSVERDQQIRPIRRENTTSSDDSSLLPTSISAAESSMSEAPRPPTASRTGDRHVQLLTRLEAILPSPTPSLRLPMPPLLLRVREEERARLDKISKEMVKTGAMPSTGGVIEGLSRLGTLNINLKDDKPRILARTYRTGGDVKAGLGVLMSQMDEIEGWFKLQRLETLVCTGVDHAPGVGKPVVCERPRPQCFRFWTSDDESVAEVLERISDEEHICPRPGCDLKQEEHVRWYFHNERKVQMSFRRVESGMGENGLDVWVKCDDCKKTSEPRKLNQIVSYFSWGKLLEILLYTTLLVPPDFCSHASNVPSPVVTHIRSPHTIVNLSTGHVSVLDTRLPKLQVGPNVSKRKAERVGAADTANGLLKRHMRQSAFDEVRDDLSLILAILRQNVALARETMLHDLSTPERNKANEIEPQHPISPSTLDTFERDLCEAEADLFSHIETCPAGNLNNVRQHLIALYTQFTERLSAVNGKKGEQHASSELPAYFGDRVYALPGSSVLVREDEPSSIIACALSSVSYLTELTSSNATQAALLLEGTRSWLIEVKRKETPRDLLSLRTITKKRSDASIVRSEHRFPLNITPNQPSLELSLDQVEGKSQLSDRMEDIVKSISKATAQDPGLTLNTRTRSPSLSNSPTSIPSALKPSSLSRKTSDTVRATPPSAFRPTRSVSSTSVPTTTPHTPRSISGTTTPRSTTPTQEPAKEGWSSVTSTFTNSFNSLLKMGSDVGSFRARNGDRSLASLIGPLSMMSSMDSSLTNTNADDRPHIQMTYTLPEKLSIACTIYYATAFDSLRRRCAVDRSIIESLSRCEAWDAQGGKSKASFFMTSDKRYIVKELVTKWNVSDTQALLEIAPSYLEYLASTHNKATGLAKIVAFTTIKIHDMQSSSKKAMDLMVMENIFYNQNVSQTYDLKGIEGRKVPKTMADGTTLFDSEWIEGQSKAPILLHPHAKRILHEAIYNDTKYLCSQSIMDYSLLLGLDHDRHELVVGLVDAIGSYNLFKTIESRSKLALTRGGEVTIIPPDQYRERFQTALKQYFMACPDKWSKTSRRHVDNALPTIF